MASENLNNTIRNEDNDEKNIAGNTPVQTDKKMNITPNDKIDNCVSNLPTVRIHLIKNLCLDKGFNFCKITNQHCSLLTKDFCKTNVPNCCRSEWVGYTSFLYILPAFFVPGNGSFAKILRILYVLQGPVSHASDYTWHNMEHVSHGIDRWLATVLVSLTIYMSLHYFGIIQTLLFGSIPLTCLYLAKRGSVTNNSKQYNISQTIWHISSPLICCYILYQMNKMNILL